MRVRSRHCTRCRLAAVVSDVRIVHKLQELQMHLLPFIAFIATTTVALPALASPRALPADQHQPVVFLDVPATWITVVPRGSNGYIGKAFLRIAGAASKSDRLRMDWRSGGKVVATGACAANWDQDDTTLAGECELEKEIKVKGPIEIDIVYSDDQQDRDYLVAVLKTEVRNWKEDRTSETWGIIPDDLLAVAFVRHLNSQSYTRTPLIQFWSTDDGLSGGSKPTMRCTVNGRKLPDFDAHIGALAAESEQSLIKASFTTPKLSRTYAFQHYQVEPGFQFGAKTKEDEIAAAAASSRGAPGPRFASDSPGKWDCTLRKGGKQIRQFLFVVDNNGMIQQSEMQNGQRAIRTLPHVVLIDMTFPDPTVEKRIRPDAMRQSIAFGLPWPEHAKAKVLKASFPKASGFPD